MAPHAGDPSLARELNVLPERRHNKHQPHNLRFRPRKPMKQQSVFLFLQSVASPLFAKLADELEARGHRCLRINFCLGDRFFWRREGATDYRGRYDEWPAFFREFVEVNIVTDLVLFGETRPLHRLAVSEAKRRQIRIHVFEEGYLRPYWLTVDEEGTNDNSGLPRNADWYLSAGNTATAALDDSPLPVSATKRACWHILYETVNLFFAWSRPYYRTHRPYHPFREKVGWLRHLTRRFVFGERWIQKKKLAQFLQSNRPFFLLPLQLDSDAQINEHSDFSNVEALMDHVFSSFAAHAPADASLVVKCHPLDNDLTPRGKLSKKLAAAHGISGRVLFIDGGHLPTLLGRAQGVVTANSTVGTSAFDHGCPVKALGRSIYNFAGLADQQSLGSFWIRPKKPDAEVYAAFRAVLRSRCLVRGSFYSKEGIASATKESAELLVGRLKAAAKNQP